MAGILPVVASFMGEMVINQWIYFETNPMSPDFGGAVSVN